jgi:hypothetical protein
VKARGAPNACLTAEGIGLSRSVHRRPCGVRSMRSTEEMLPVREHTEGRKRCCSDYRERALQLQSAESAHCHTP